MMQNFLAFRDSLITPLRRLPNMTTLPQNIHKTHCTETVTRDWEWIQEESPCAGSDIHLSRSPAVQREWWALSASRAPFFQLSPPSPSPVMLVGVLTSPLFSLSILEDVRIGEMLHCFVRVAVLAFHAGFTLCDVI